MPGSHRDSRQRGASATRERKRCLLRILGQQAHLGRESGGIGDFQSPGVITLGADPRLDAIERGE